MERKIVGIDDCWEKSNYCESMNIMMSMNVQEPPVITDNDIQLFLQYMCGNDKVTRRRWKSILFDFLEALPEGKELTKKNLILWKTMLSDEGYASKTVTSCIKCVNHFLVWKGYEELCFKHGQAKNLTGRSFGYLIALYPMKERRNKEVIWHCECICGTTIDVPYSQLVSENTVSCGCLNRKEQ